MARAPTESPAVIAPTAGDPAGVTLPGHARRRAPAGITLPDIDPSDTSPWWRPEAGERALIVGQTGSGKTTFAVWLLERLPNSPVLIYDTKEEPKFLTLKKSALAHSYRDVIDLSTDHGVDYIVFRPPVLMLSDPRALDNYLLVHYQYLRGVDAYIDELYSFHNHGNAGPGLVALYTRGRSRGITTIASTQRPAWISKFSMSEAQLFYQFFLAIATDRKTLADASGIVPLDNPPRHSFWAWRSGAHIDPPQLIRPIRHDAALAGYTDAPDVPEIENPSAVPAIGHTWI